MKNPKLKDEKILQNSKNWSTAKKSTSQMHLMKVCSEGLYCFQLVVVANTNFDTSLIGEHVLAHSELYSKSKVCLLVYLFVCVCLAVCWQKTMLHWNHNFSVKIKKVKSNIEILEKYCFKIVNFPISLEWDMNRL